MKRFECYKSFSERQIFIRGNDRVVYEVLWRKATLVFPDDEVPSADSSGHYLDFRLPDDHNYYDEKSSNLEIHVKDSKLRKKVETIMEGNNEELEEQEDYDQKLIKLGFDMEARFDIRPSEDGWATVTITDE
jgi:hypothetical protein